MDKPKLLEVLAALPEGGVKRTKTGRIRELLPEIEAAQAAGYANEDIAKALARQGLEVTKKTLETMLYRIRKERSEGGHPAPSTRLAGMQVSQPATAQGAAKAADLDVRKMPEEASTESSPTGMAGGKLASETILEAPSKSYSFKQLQKAKDSK